MEPEQICGNCAHWLGYSKLFSVGITYYANKFDTKPVTRTFAPCRACAVQADAGDHIVLTTENGHCRYQEEEAFTPAPWYYEELKEQHLDEDALYGLKPGIDFPATLNRGL